MNLRLVASLLLLASLALPWKVTWGTNEFGFSTSWFVILEFPFAVETALFAAQQETWTTWELYNSVPKYAGTALVVLGVILSLRGCARRKQGSLVEFGGVSSLVGLVLFSGSGYEEVYIQYPLFQTYASLPVGMFVPVVFWILVFVQSQKTKPRNSRVTSTKSAYFCGSCGKIISSEYVFCPFCGKENRKVACESCGTSISAWSVYCPHCGTRIQREPEKSLVL